MTGKTRVNHQRASSRCCPLSWAQVLPGTPGGLGDLWDTRHCHILASTLLPPFFHTFLSNALLFSLSHLRLHHPVLSSIFPTSTSSPCHHPAPPCRAVRLEDQQPLPVPPGEAHLRRDLVAVEHPGVLGPPRGASDQLSSEPSRTLQDMRKETRTAKNALNRGSAACESIMNMFNEELIILTYSHPFLSFLGATCIMQLRSSSAHPRRLRLLKPPVQLLPPSVNPTICPAWAPKRRCGASQSSSSPHIAEHAGPAPPKLQNPKRKRPGAERRSLRRNLTWMPKLAMAAMALCLPPNLSRHQGSSGSSSPHPSIAQLHWHHRPRASEPS